MTDLDNLLERIDHQQFQQLSEEIHTMINEHQIWFNKLNLTLFSSADFDYELDNCDCSFKRCSFGRWLHTLMQSPDFQQPFFISLDQLHRSFHRLANQLLQAAQQQTPIDHNIYAELTQVQQRLLSRLLELLEFSVVSKNQFDPTTGLMNRRSVNTVLSYEKQRMQRQNRTQCCIALVDIDHFKGINDSFGHDIGDIVLKEVADILLSITRESDTIARYGGEEFLFVLPDIDLPEAIDAIERVRQKLAATIISAADKAITVTASFGVTQLCNHCSIANSIKRADLALYQAKEAGRNQTTFIDVTTFDDAEREIGTGPVTDTFNAVALQHCQRVSEL